MPLIFHLLIHILAVLGATHAAAPNQVANISRPDLPRADSRIPNPEHGFELVLFLAICL